MSSADSLVNPEFWISSAGWMCDTSSSGSSGMVALVGPIVSPRAKRESDAAVELMPVLIVSSYDGSSPERIDTSRSGGGLKEIWWPGSPPLRRGPLVAFVGRYLSRSRLAFRSLSSHSSSLVAVFFMHSSRFHFRWSSLF